MRALIVTLIFPLITALHVPPHYETRRTTLHQYPPAYRFDTRDGWNIGSVSNLNYKHAYRNSTNDESSRLHDTHPLEGRSKKRKGQGVISGAIKTVVDATLKGIGKIESVTITWYTGNDLKNPSCWNKSGWAPSDNSFVCAVTLEGWTDRPKCFRFLELCNGAKKCIFVRVVDTCAGCAKGSKHVDLTKAAFQTLATLDQGTLQVQMRLATDPQEWNEALWGPKHA